MVDPVGWTSVMVRKLSTGAIKWGFEFNIRFLLLMMSRRRVLALCEYFPWGAV